MLLIISALVIVAVIGMRRAESLDPATGHQD
jgi:hypothetical protein